MPSGQNVRGKSAKICLSIFRDHSWWAVSGTLANDIPAYYTRQRRDTESNGTIDRS